MWTLFTFHIKIKKKRKEIIVFQSEHSSQEVYQEMDGRTFKSCIWNACICTTYDIFS